MPPPRMARICKDGEVMRWVTACRAVRWCGAVARRVSASVAATSSSVPAGMSRARPSSVGMPHVLWELQGEQRAVFAEEKDPHDAAKTIHVFEGFEQIKPGTMTTQEYDSAVADLVNFMQWMSEPGQNKRKQLGVVVLLFLTFLCFLAWRLNESYWKEVK